MEVTVALVTLFSVVFFVWVDIAHKIVYHTGLQHSDNPPDPADKVYLPSRPGSCSERVQYSQHFKGREEAYQQRSASVTDIINNIKYVAYDFS